MIFRVWLCIWTKERVVFRGLFVHHLYVILKVNVEIKHMHLLRSCLKCERGPHHPLVLYQPVLLYLLLHMVALEPVALRRGGRRHVGGTGLDIATQEVSTT